MLLCLPMQCLTPNHILLVISFALTSFMAMKLNLDEIINQAEMWFLLKVIVGVYC
jgi:hypothetical protein